MCSANEAGVDVSGERITGILNDGMLALLMSMGHELGLFEALAKISPASTRRIAEETGLIWPIGDFVLEQACRQALDWQRIYPHFDSIAVNIFEYGGERVSVTLTFGVATHRKGEKLDSCIARADTAMYHGKERGRNRVMIGSYKGLTLVN